MPDIKVLWHSFCDSPTLHANQQSGSTQIGMINAAVSPGLWFVSQLLTDVSFVIYRRPIKAVAGGTYINRPESTADLANWYRKEDQDYRFAA